MSSSHQPLGTFDGYSFYGFTEEAPADLAMLEALTTEAWDHDYQDRTYLRFDQRALRWLLVEVGSAGVIGYDPDGEPVACLLGAKRRFRWRGREHDVGYYTGLTVVPAHRGKGLSNHLIRVTMEHLLGPLQLDFMCGIFDVGAAGQPAWASYTRKVEEQSLIEGPKMTLWAAAGDMAEVDSYEPLSGVERLALLPGLRSLVEFRGSDRDRALVMTPTTPSELGEAAIPEGDIVTLPTKTLDQTYGPSDPRHHGLVSMDIDGESVALGYHVSALARAGLPDHRLAHIQLVYRQGASTSACVRALRALTTRLLDEGCLSVTCMDSGMLPRMALLRAGFMPMPRQLIFVMIGRNELIGGRQIESPLQVELI